jgi:hypothetical protein
MNPVGSFLMTNELLARNERQAAEDEAELRRRPDATPMPADETDELRPVGWLARILAGHRPQAIRRKSAHI